MNILHYTLGLFPQRAGGLNRYATDLMMEQMRLGHKVSVIVPGKWRPWAKECSIRKAGGRGELRCYRLDNAQPLPLLCGIRHPADFCGGKVSTKSLAAFFQEVEPEVLHLHTLMGIPEDVLRFFKEKDVKIVYTSHDYFGICPRVNLIDIEGKLCVEPDAERCATCNGKAPSTIFLRMRNSCVAMAARDTERWLKNTLTF